MLAPRFWPLIALLAVTIGTVAGCGSSSGGGGETENTGGMAGSAAGGSASGGKSSSGGRDGGDAGDSGAGGSGGSTPRSSKSATAVVAGGTVAHSENFTVILTLGESPGGNRSMSSSGHRANLGLIGATQQ